MITPYDGPCARYQPFYIPYVCFWGWARTEGRAVLVSLIFTLAFEGTVCLCRQPVSKHLVPSAPAVFSEPCCMVVRYLNLHFSSLTNLGATAHKFGASPHEQECFLNIVDRGTNALASQLLSAGYVPRNCRNEPLKIWECWPKDCFLEGDSDCCELRLVRNAVGAREGDRHLPTCSLTAMDSVKPKDSSAQFSLYCGHPVIGLYFYFCYQVIY